MTPMQPGWRGAKRRAASAPAAAVRSSVSKPPSKSTARGAKVRCEKTSIIPELSPPPPEAICEGSSWWRPQGCLATWQAKAGFGEGTATRGLCVRGEKVRAPARLCDKGLAAMDVSTLDAGLSVRVPDEWRERQLAHRLRRGHRYPTRRIFNEPMGHGVNDTRGRHGGHHRGDGCRVIHEG
eukprot:scaffold325519_cov54-Tisochrysis_lutea.AAC.5